MHEPDFQRLERIEAYVSGKLGGEELRTFESELAQDERLRAEVEVERTLSGTLQRGQELRFRDLVQRVSGAQEQKTTQSGVSETPVIPIQHGRWKWLAAAASVALVVGLALQQWVGGNGLPADALAELNAGTGYEFSGLRSGAADDLDDQLNELRRTGQLEAYLERSGELLKKDTAFARQFHDPVILDRAIVWLRLNEPDKAMAELTALRDPQRWENCEAAVVRGLVGALQDNRSRVQEEFRRADRAGCLPGDLREWMD
ncbi:MAG: hypothetical protein IT228_04715 [Flavobacteriales bacterium]|nr:hypothetical protein [Flavobacteriales bacterium]MCC6576626.1 hypothetical protein [Flavobacteriales bacterium]NUQ15106.1 hypothetical protein [Flavobacteriales bacterium]